MRIVLLVPLFLATISAGQVPARTDGDPVTVLEFKWFRDRKAPAAEDTSKTGPVRAVISENKKFQREARAQLSPGAIDPNEMTVDGRSAALEKITQESRSKPAKAVDGFAYSARIQNTADAAIDIIFLEFQFTERANPANLVRRQFLCAVRVKPGQKSEVQAFSPLGPSSVISVESLSSDATKLFDSAVMINRVEFSNGAILQRKDWDFKALRASIVQATSAPWGREMCRGF